MNILEGHPGAIFSWFFDSDQASDQRVQLFFFLYGSGKAVRRLSESCMLKQNRFNDVLGPEILFVFFNPEATFVELSEDGASARGRITKGPATRFLFSGSGEARAVPAALIEIGRAHFRSNRPGDHHFSDLVSAAAEAHERAIPFFQQAFDLQPLQSYLVWGHRTQRSVSVFEMREDATVTADDLISLFKPLRAIARHSRGAQDLDAIDGLIEGAVQHAGFAAVARKSWNVLNRSFKLG